MLIYTTCFKRTKEWEAFSTLLVFEFARLKLEFSFPVSLAHLKTEMIYRCVVPEETTLQRDVWFRNRNLSSQTGTYTFTEPDIDLY